MKNTTLVGLVGLRGSGKSEVAAQIQAHLGDDQVVLIEYVDVVNDAANRLLGMDLGDTDEWVRAVQDFVGCSATTDFDHHELTQFLARPLPGPVSRANKAEYRPLLAWLGGFVAVALEPSFWDQAVKQAIYDAAPRFRYIFVGGVRFPSNVDLIHSLGGRVWKINRPGVEQVTSATTENQVHSLDYDELIINNGSLSDLRQKVLGLL